MDIVREKIAAYTALLEREVEAPTGDLGFGSDLSCTDDLTADMAEIAGDSPLAVAQANVRRLTTPRGSVPDAPDDCIDVRDFLNKGMTPDQVGAIPSKVRAELRKDDRNDETLQVTLTVSPDLKSFDLDVRGEASTGPWSLILAVTDGGALLKEINGAANS